LKNITDYDRFFDAKHVAGLCIDLNRDVELVSAEAEEMIKEYLWNR